MKTIETFPVFTRPPSGLGFTMRESIELGKYFHVSVPGWASGGWDTHADNPEIAALQIGCAFKAFGFTTDLPTRTEVLQHLPSSRIGCAFLESCGEFATSTGNHFDI